MGISPDQIYKWTEEGRPVNLTDDVGQLYDDNSVLNTATSTRAYVNYVISQCRHEDFERDACEHLVNPEGPYADIWDEVYRKMAGEVSEDSREIGMSFDNLADYMTESQTKDVNGEWVSVGIPVNVSEEVLKVYLFRYLDALIRVCSDREEWEEIPSDLVSNFKNIIKLKIFKALAALAR